MIIKGLLSVGFIFGVVYFTSSVISYFWALVLAFFCLFVVKGMFKTRGAK